MKLTRDSNQIFRKIHNKNKHFWVIEIWGSNKNLNKKQPKTIWNQLSYPSFLLLFFSEELTWYIPEKQIHVTKII